MFVVFFFFVCALMCMVKYFLKRSNKHLILIRLITQSIKGSKSSIYVYMCIHVCMNMPSYVPIYTCTYVSLYTEEYVNYKLTYSHSKLANFTIIMNKWTVLKLLQNFEFLLSKYFCTLITM